MQASVKPVVHQSRNHHIEEQNNCCTINVNKNTATPQFSGPMLLYPTDNSETVTHIVSLELTAMDTSLDLYMICQHSKGNVFRHLSMGTNPWAPCSPAEPGERQTHKPAQHRQKRGEPLIKLCEAHIQPRKLLEEPWDSLQSNEPQLMKVEFDKTSENSSQTEAKSRENPVQCLQEQTEKEHSEMKKNRTGIQKQEKSDATKQLVKSTTNQPKMLPESSTKNFARRQKKTKLISVKKYKPKMSAWKYKRASKQPNSCTTEVIPDALTTPKLAASSGQPFYFSSKLSAETYFLFLAF